MGNKKYIIVLVNGWCTTPTAASENKGNNNLVDRLG